MTKPIPDPAIITQLSMLNDGGAALLAYLAAFAPAGGTVHNYMPSCGVTTVYNGCTIIENGSKKKTSGSSSSPSPSPSPSESRRPAEPRPPEPTPPSPSTPSSPPSPEEEEALDADDGCYDDDDDDEGDATPDITPPTSSPSSEGTDVFSPPPRPLS